MKVLLEDRALHGNRLVARKFGKSRFKNDKMGHFRRTLMREGDKPMCGMF